MKDLLYIIKVICKSCVLYLFSLTRPFLPLFFFLSYKMRKAADLRLMEMYLQTCVYIQYPYKWQVILQMINIFYRVNVCPR